MVIAMLPESYLGKQPIEVFEEYAGISALTAPYDMFSMDVEIEERSEGMPVTSILMHVIFDQDYVKEIMLLNN